ncbi:MAG TPA: CRISPR-associated helicase Cas3' [Candidatus Omnitrophota bacterium]|nr:CRISPR-associated helicase Cas3' [Candidatus Omnitrophota bacterium]HQO57808.1 CRISPR-associated helicase Cas3' [Candidatus Omnitrophota bacterium]
MGDDINYYRYWGKLSRDKKGIRYHLLAYHSLDVAAVGIELLKVCPFLNYFCEKLSVRKGCFLESFAFLCAVHDIGKFAEGFQNLCPDLYKILNNKKSFAVYSDKHWSLGYRFLCDYVQVIFNAQKNVFLDVLDCWLAASAGHHGRPPKNELFSSPLICRFSPDGVRDALKYISEVKSLFGQYDFDCLVEKEERFLKVVSWDLAGLIVLADWIGSNEAWFKYHQDPLSLQDYWQEIALPSARKAIQSSGLFPLPVAKNKSTKQLFPSIPVLSPVQTIIEQIVIPLGPKLFIIEDLTGSGKTEAALVLAHRLMAAGETDGFYFGLPTMATANAMHDRVEAVYKELYAPDSDPSLILAHSKSKQYLAVEKESNEQRYTKDEESAGQEAQGWLFDNRKKAFLANVGVGTIDQALLGILPVRHQALRLLGLFRKVLIIDEVHAYDSYTNRLLCNLLEFHAARQGHAILLSATLPKALRKKLIEAFAQGMQSDISIDIRNEYPLITQISRTGSLGFSVSSPEYLHKNIKVIELHDVKNVISLIESALQKGKSVCWIRNTVQDATDAYSLAADITDEGNITLFHARFALGDRLAIEQNVVGNFGPKSSAQDRRGKLVVATQVAEQSLDLDFDFMVTDLAPIDLIIQRAGRLCRHHRDRLGNPAKIEERGLQEMAVYMPEMRGAVKRDWYSTVFPRASKVYEHHGQLWLTAQWLVQHKAFRMPADSREMIEYVYGEENQEEIPTSLQYQENKADGNARAKSSLAQYNGLRISNGYMADMLSWPNDDNVPTRVGEPTITVRLARRQEDRLVPYYNNDWLLSEVSIYRSLVATEDDADQEVIAQAKETMSDKGKYCVVIPLREVKDGFEGLARNGQGQRVKVYYTRKYGLRIEQEGD